MTVDKLESPALRLILTEMCARVGADPEGVDVSADGWYKTSTWTSAQEREFAQWLEDELYDNSKLRKDFMRNPNKVRRDIRGTVQMFLFNYGWKIDDGA